MELRIEDYNTELKSQVLNVWEKSVLASHHFLTNEDFIEIKALFNEYDFGAITMLCLMDGEKVSGFLGLYESKIEMLFLDPHYMGKGLGKKLIEFAVQNHRVCWVDVNEQNSNATRFYQRLGFEVFERTDKDDFGKDYPLLRMRLKEV
ncbi:MAG: GNAT family N-acetyltransferase [Sphingobacteriales bacterium]|nr:MAG: GNAT family N-acetyltransferase [Sphingobacteriales bacterium]